MRFVGVEPGKELGHLRTHLPGVGKVAAIRARREVGEVVRQDAFPFVVLEVRGVVHHQMGHGLRLRKRQRHAELRACGRAVNHAAWTGYLGQQRVIDAHFTKTSESPGHSTTTSRPTSSSPMKGSTARQQSAKLALKATDATMRFNPIGGVR